jgi:hypothetical protein
MRIGRALQLAAFFLLVGAGVQPAAAYCAGSSDFPLSDLRAEFEGTVDGERVRLFLAFDAYGDSATAVHGAVRGTTKTGSDPRHLEGRMGSDCVVTVTEGREPIPDAVWTLRYIDEGKEEVLVSRTRGRFVGYHRPRGARRSAIRLELVPEPPCDGRGPWRTFRSAAWPITFEYPSSWLISAGDDQAMAAITLECPSLRQSLSGSDIIELRAGFGTGQIEKGPEGQLIRRLREFFTADGNDWFTGYCWEDGGSMDVDHNGVLDAPCAEARRSIVGGTTVLQATPHEYRSPTPLLFMFLLPDGWVDLQCSGDDDLYGRGEVVLGDDVVSRLVRSVKLTVPTP